jgi:hypothetical protein
MYNLKTKIYEYALHLKSNCGHFGCIYTVSQFASNLKLDLAITNADTYSIMAFTWLEAAKVKAISLPSAA